MLDLAVNYIPQLQHEYFKAIVSSRCFYYSIGSSREYSIQIENNNANKLQYVSVNAEGELMGYVECSLNRSLGIAYDLAAIRFRRSTGFSEDMFHFVDMVFNRFGLNKLVWSVVLGNPAKRFYDKLVLKYRVRGVGTFKEDVMLDDGKFYDVAYYEYLARDYRQDVIDHPTKNAHNYRKPIGGGE